MRTAGQILSSLVADDRDPHSLPERLCRQCRSVLPIDGVGLALMTDAGHQGVIAATDGPATLMEDLQFTLGEGPCMDASRERRPVLQPDLARTASSRWPEFGPAVLNAGISAIFAFPLQIGAIRLGILDLYRTAPGNLNDKQLADALAYADAGVAILLQLQGTMAAGQGLHAQIGHPLESRAEIHQATGVVSVQAVVGVTEALVLLRAHAYAVDQPILKIARKVLAGRLRFDSETDDHE
jgi:hypothetical protein